MTRTKQEGRPFDQVQAGGAFRFRKAGPMLGYSSQTILWLIPLIRSISKGTVKFKADLSIDLSQPGPCWQWIPTRR